MKIYDVKGIGASLTGSFSGSFGGLFTGVVDGVSATSSYVEYTDVVNKPALVSGSSQVLGFNVFATTGSNGFNGNQSITGSLTVTGQVIAQTLNVQQVTSSIVFSSGSNIFGNSLSNNHRFTGSVNITGSLTVNGVTTTLSEYVPYTGATKNVDLGIYDLDVANLNIDGAGSGGGALRLKQFEGSEANREGYSTISTLTSGVFYFTSATTAPNFKNFVLNPSGLTDNTIRTYTLPNTDGTLALTSDLNSYLLLTGGTLTGALNGTSATFSSTASFLTNTGASTSEKQIIVANTGGSMRAGVESSAGGAIQLGTLAYAAVFGNQNNAATQLTTNGTARLTILGNGNVGIGVASPSARLHVLNSTGGNTSSNYVQVEGSIADNSNYPGIVLKGGTLATTYPTISLTNGGLGLSLNGGFATAYNNPTQINLNNGVISFFTGNNASATERMQITSGGSMYVGASVDSAATSTFVSGLNGFGAKVSNNAFFLFTGLNSSDVRTFYVLGTGDVKNTNNSYGAISDIKLKENIEDATPKLDDLMNVKIRNYNLIGDDKKQIGVIAQELEEVFPNMVDEVEDYEEVEIPQLDTEGNEILDKEGQVVTTKERVSKGTITKSVKYSVFVPMLIKAIQELKAELDTAKTEIQLLKQQ